MSALLSLRSISIFLAGLVGSCLVGFAAFGVEIFNPRSVVFQFVGSGAIAGALAAAFALGRARAVWIVAGTTIALFLATTRPNTSSLLFRDIVYVPTLVAAVWLADRFGSKVPFARFGKVLAWGIVFAACHFAMFGILTVANSAPFHSEIASAATRVGGLVGVGVGLGVQLVGRLESAKPSAVS